MATTTTKTETETDKMDRAAEIGRGNAMMAMDQWEAYSSKQDAIESHLQNTIDSVAEERLGVGGQIVAVDVFHAVLDRAAG